MIKQTKSGFKVVSSSGKSLSKGNSTKGEAKKRLREVEYFKHKGKK